MTTKSERTPAFHKSADGTLRCDACQLHADTCTCTAGVFRDFLKQMVRVFARAA